MHKLRQRKQIYSITLHDYVETIKLVLDATTDETFAKKKCLRHVNPQIIPEIAAVSRFSEHLPVMLGENILTCCSAQNLWTSRLHACTNVV